MSQAREGDRQTLGEFRSYLYLLARTSLPERGAAGMDASDLVQQTLMDAHAKRDQFRGASEAERAAWLKKILSNNLKDALRRQGRAKRDVSRERALVGGVDESFARAEGWLQANQSSPSQHLAKHEEILRLPKALEQLPDVQREAIVLHHLQGLTLAQTAAQLQRSETAVAGLLFRGLKKLHELLDAG